MFRHAVKGSPSNLSDLLETSAKTCIAGATARFHALQRFPTADAEATFPERRDAEDAERREGSENVVQNVNKT